MKRIFVLFFVLMIFSCAKQIEKKVEVPPVSTTLPRESMWDKYKEKMEAIDRQGVIKTLEVVIPKVEKQEKNFLVNDNNFSSKEYSEKLKTFHNLLINNVSPNEIFLFLKENFDIEKINPANEEKTLFTGYYIPTFEARFQEDEIFKYPIYKKPEDLKLLKLSPLGIDFKNVILYGKVEDNGFKVPYYSRKEIDKEKILKGKNLEIAYLKDPLEILILQIQGSGILVMEDGNFYLASFASKNGHPYKSIGKYIAGKNYISEDEVSFDNIREFLKKNPDKYDEIIYQNQSYIFFNLKKEIVAFGSSGLPLIENHSIAVDKNYIPLLSMCLADFDKPIVGEENLVTGFNNFTEIVFAMDEGSAIKGERRIDLFLGFGDEAGKVAHRLKSEGHLFVLVPKFPN